MTLDDSVTLTEELDSHPTSVYLYYDRVGVLIYVGITGRGAIRNGEHNRGKDWWPFVQRQEVEHYGSRKEAAVREKQLIRTFRPPFNKQHNAAHSQIKQDYLALGVGDWQMDWSTALEWARKLNRWLPLTLDNATWSGVKGGYSVTLRTMLAHAQLSHRFHPEEGIPAFDAFGRQTGILQTVAKAGPITMLTVHVSEKTDIAETGYAVLSVSDSKLGRFKARSLHLRPSEEARQEQLQLPRKLRPYGAKPPHHRRDLRPNSKGRPECP